MAAHSWSEGFVSLEDEHDHRIDDIDGTIPPSLRGTLYRNGAGRNQLAGDWFAHWFDGDGMVQAIRFDGAGVHYRNRYVRTPNYLEETAAGRIRRRGFGKMRPGGMLANAFRRPANVSNTSVVVQNGRLLSLWEGGPPFELDGETLETRRLADFGGTVEAFSAHPKIDPATGALFNFGIDYGPRTTLTPYRLEDGAITRLPTVTLPYPVMNHDFVLTENYLVFCLGPILVRTQSVMLGLSSFDAALHWEPSKPTLILLVPHDGRGPTRIVETEPFFQFHFANGYEDDGAIVVDLARYPDYLTIGQALRDYWRSPWPAQGMAALTRLRIDPAAGRVEARDYGCGTANEFPRINPAFAGRRYRYAYVACNPADSTQGLQQRIAKVDLESGTASFHHVGQGRFVGEPVFVPTGTDGEDDGVIVALVFDSIRKRTDIVGLDARDVAARPLFTARLPYHVPYSLHGFFAAA